MSRTVREPIQTYLTAAERDDLDRAARELGVSRSEALRRGVRALLRGRPTGALADLEAKGLVAPAATGPSGPPPAAPVTTLDDLLDELAADRANR